MNAGPYSDERVQRHIEEEFVPLKSECFWDRPTELMRRFDIVWTPTFLVHDSEGKEHYRLMGYVPLDDFLAHLKLGKGKLYFNTKYLDKAIAQFRRVIEEHSHTGSVPEAVYLLGVVEYKRTHDGRALRRVYDTLSSRYPQSEWARRTEPYAQIPA